MPLMLHEMLTHGGGGADSYPPSYPGLDPGEILFVVGTTTSSGPTIAYPPGIKVGDLVVLVDRAGAGRAPIPSEVVPAGYTKIYSETFTATRSPAAYQRTTVSYIVAPTPLTGNANGQSGSASNAKAIVVFRKTNNAPIKTATGRSYGQQSSSTAASETINIPAANIPKTGVLFSVASTYKSYTINAHTMSVGGHRINPMPYMSLVYHSMHAASPAVTCNMTTSKSHSILGAVSLEIT